MFDKTTENGDGSPQVNGEMNGHRKQFRIVLRKVLLGKNDHRSVKNEYIIDGTLFGAFAFVVNDFRFRKIIVFIATELNAVGQIDVLAIHEKCFIQESNFLQGFFPHQHKRTAEHVHFIRFEFTQIPQVIASKTLRFWEKLGQSENLVKRYLGRW